MDEHQALAIVSALADGANPVTGEIFSADSPYQSPDVIRALFVAVRALEARVSANRNSNAESGARIAWPGLQQSAPAKPSSDHGNSGKPNPGKLNLGKPNSEKPNSGKPWSADEDQRLLAAFDSKTPLPEIAAAHGRTMGGVRARLEKHGRLEPSPATRWPPNPVRAQSQDRKQYPESPRDNGSP